MMINDVICVYMPINTFRFIIDNLSSQMQQKEVENPFADHKQFFATMPKAERAAWTRKMLGIPQKKGEFPIFKKDYPESRKWKYQNYNLHYACIRHKQEQKCRALVFSFHGLNAHGGSSGYLASTFHQKCAADVYALDFKNFGQSQGDFRGLISSFDDLLEQSEGFIDFVCSQYKNQKAIYISGLSLGGAICFKLSLRQPNKYAGVIFFSPALRQNKEAQPILKKIGRCIGTYFPRWQLVNQTFNAQTKIDQTERIMGDPFVYTGKVVPGSVKVTLQVMEEIQKQWSKFTSPFIIIQSGSDKLVDPFLAVDFEEQCKSEDKTVIYCKDMWHAVYGEDELPHIANIVADWLRKRIK